MGSSLLPVLALLVITACSVYGLGGNCPPPSKVYSTKPICREDYDCGHGRVCCPNLANQKSCTEPSGNNGNSYYSTGSRQEYCGGRKCALNEECREDPRTRMKVCVPKGKRFP